MLDAATTLDCSAQGLPDAMRLLLDAYPRDSWAAHPGFREKTRQWLGAHRMFRHMAERHSPRCRGLPGCTLAAEDYAARLSQVGGALVGNLHGHHGWEDRSYFPELSAADPRFERGWKSSNRTMPISTRCWMGSPARPTARSS